MASKPSSMTIVALALVSLVSSMPGPAFGQPEAAAGPDATGTLEAITVQAQKRMPIFRIETSSRGPIEELTVRGQRSPAAYRIAIEAARDKIYEVFNELNSSDEFDVHCGHERRTGTRIPQRVCRPNFLDDATAEAGKAFLDAIFFNDSAALGLSRAQVAHGRAHYKQRQLTEEMQRLMIENPDLRQAMLEYIELQQDYQEARERRRR